jgi:HlyD family secretion protein
MKTHGLLYLPLLILAGCSAPAEAPLQPIVDVKVAKAEISDVKITVRAPASLYAREQANIGSRVTAPIQKLFVQKGDNVAAGQLLAQLDNRDLIAQQTESVAAVTEAEANLQRVMSGTLPTDIERARGQLVAAEAALNEAQKNHERRRKLFEQGAIPQRDLLASQTELAQANASHEVAQKSLDLLQNQSRDKDVLMAKSKVEQAQARLALIKAQLEFTEIRSASTGTITEQFMFPGDMAKSDAPIFTVMDLSSVVARAQVAEVDAAGVRNGQACAFVPTDGGGASFDGRISMINQAVDPARRTVEAWCEIPNSKRALRGGAFGQLTIVTGIDLKSLVVPAAAVQFIEGTRKGFVMVVGEKGVATKKDVETGEAFEGNVQIKNGLAAADTVIIQGGYGLPEGTKIRIQEEKKP